MVPEISKAYTYSFDLIWAKLYEDIGCRDGILFLYYFTGQSAKFQQFFFWNFNMGVNGKILYVQYL